MTISVVPARACNRRSKFRISLQPEYLDRVKLLLGLSQKKMIKAGLRLVDTQNCSHDLEFNHMHTFFRRYVFSY